MSIAIVGVGETDYVFKDDRTVRTMALDATRRALNDAGLRPEDVDGFVTEAFSMGNLAPVEEVAQRLGVQDRTFSVQLNQGGSAIVGAPQMARLAIEAGLASVVVCYYSISLSKLAGGAASYYEDDTEKAAFEMPFGYYGQPVYFATIASRYKALYGLAPEATGAVAVSSRRHAARTENALRREPVSIEEYLASPFVAEPLRRLDCCLNSDGAIAFVMTSLERARDLAKPPVVVAGTGYGAAMVSQAQYFSQKDDILTTPASIAGPRAFAEAGLSPADMDFAEIYDCFTITLLLELENLGFVDRGEAGEFVASGGIDPDGSLPVNTHGGLLSQAYLVGGNHVIEAVRQIRGERGEGQLSRAEVGLVYGQGAPEGAALVLTRDR